jgi:Tfp pilus assembly protein PilN
LVAPVGQLPLVPPAAGRCSRRRRQALHLRLLLLLGLLHVLRLVLLVLLHGRLLLPIDHAVQQLLLLGSSIVWGPLLLSVW